jgi:TfoX/Sxy family transcriptional regulator of competence genes
MVAPYLQELRSILDDRKPEQGRSATIECKHFFSGAAAYADGRIFMTLTPAGLALKLPEADVAALLAQGATPLRYFPKAPVKRDYVVVPDSMREHTEALGPLIEASIEYCQKFPKPKPRKPRPSKRERGGGPATGR